MQRMWLMLMIFIVGIMVLPACAASSEPVPEIDATALYTDNCASCHGVNRSDSSPVGPLLNPQRLATLSDSEVKDTILNGRPGTAMAAFKSSLSLEEVDALLQLIKYTAP